MSVSSGETIQSGEASNQRRKSAVPGPQESPAESKRLGWRLAAQPYHVIASMSVWDKCCALVPAMALLPLLIPHAVGISLQHHMQFSLLFWAAVALFTNRALRSDEVRDMSRKQIAIVSFGVFAVIATWAAWRSNYWLGSLAAVGIFFAWSLGRWGAMHWTKVALVSAILLFTIGWPLFWVDGPIHVAARLFAASLDALVQPNVISVRGIKTIGSELSFEFFVGPVNLLVISALAIVYSYHRHRSLVHSLLLMGAGLGALVLSTYIMMWIATSMGQDLIRDETSFLWFAILQTLYFFFSLLVIWNLDKVLESMFRGTPPGDPDTAAAFNLFNLLLSWPFLPKRQVLVKLDGIQLAISKRPSSEDSKPTEFDWLQQSWPKVIIMVGTTLLFVSAIPASIHLWWQLSSDRLVYQQFKTIGQAFKAETMEAADRLEKVGNWVQLDVVAREARAGGFGKLVWTHEWDAWRVRTTMEPISSCKWLPDPMEPRELRVLSTRILKDIDRVGDVELTRCENSFGGRVYVAAATLTLDFAACLGRSESLRNERHANLFPWDIPALDTQAVFRLTTECETGRPFSDTELEEFVASVFDFRDRLAPLYRSVEKAESP